MSKHPTSIRLSAEARAILDPRSTADSGGLSGALNRAVVRYGAICAAESGAMTKAVNRLMRHDLPIASIDVITLAAEAIEPECTTARAVALVDAAERKAAK